MTLRSYLWGLRIGTLICLGAFCAVIFFTDPIDTGFVAFVFFYITFFLLVSGVGILLLTWIWRKMAKEMVTLGEIGMAVRQGILLGSFMTIIVGMQQAQVLLWWSALVVAGAVFLVELYFLTR